MIKQNRQLPEQPTVPTKPEPANREPLKEVLVGSGHNKILSICHGGMLVPAMTSLAGMIAVENAAGYSFVETIRINNGEMLVVFERKK